MSSLQPAADWHSISKALPRTTAAAAESVAAAFRRLGIKSSSRDPAPWSSLAHDGSETVPWPRQGEEPTLPPDHPHTIRVRRIAANIIAAACDDQTYAGRRGLLQRIRRPFDGVDWRVEVFDSEYVDAYGIDDGRIRLSTALVRTETDADIAATVGHEVGHVISRHGWKTLKNMCWAAFLANFAAELLDVPRDEDDAAWEEPLFMRPCYIRQEFEADHLGLFLVAAAGYDPRMVPALWKRLALTQEASLPSVHDTHPEYATRAQVLSQAKVMDEAMDLYRQAVRSGKGAEALDSWKSTFDFALSWWLYWSSKWLPPDHWNRVRNSIGFPPPNRWNPGVRNWVTNNHAVARHAAPANIKWNRDIIVGSLAVQQAIYQQSGTGYPSSWQLQSDVHYVAKPLWESGTPPKAKFFMWQLLHGRLWTTEPRERC